MRVIEPEKVGKIIARNRVWDFGDCRSQISFRLWYLGPKAPYFVSLDL